MFPGGLWAGRGGPHLRLQGWPDELSSTVWSSLKALEENSSLGYVTQAVGSPFSSYLMLLPFCLKRLRGGDVAPQPHPTSLPTRTHMQPRAWVLYKVFSFAMGVS